MKAAEPTERNRHTTRGEPWNVTRWVENPGGGRARGPLGLARAWIEVIVRPRRFFRNGVAPGDQAAGLTFAVLVTVAYLGGKYALVPGTAPVLGGRPLLSAGLAIAAAGLVVAPIALHLVAALQTVLLIPVVPERAGVSETVQVIAYATAPCALAGIPVPALRLACALYGTGLLVVGIGVVHDTSVSRSAVATALPAIVVFGFAFGGLSALRIVPATY